MSHEIRKSVALASWLRGAKYVHQEGSSAVPVGAPVPSADPLAAGAPVAAADGPVTAAAESLAASGGPVAAAGGPANGQVLSANGAAGDEPAEVGAFGVPLGEDPDPGESPPPEKWVSA